jgi:uncharacterized protein (DUF488 family)
MKAQRNQAEPVLEVFTIGHSTRSFDQFARLLKAFSVRRVVDVRTIPRSRHNPQFNRDVLSRALHGRRIHYRHMKALGGLRRARADSINLGWHNASFRGFADYMQTPAFKQALEGLILLARDEPAAILCAEAVPWRCHRSLIADALTVRGVRVRHIVSSTRADVHVMTPFALVRGEEVTYPAEHGGRAHRACQYATPSLM